MACPLKPMSSCRQRQPFAERHPQLPFDQIDARDQLGHGMLDLQARVHLDEEHVLAVGDELDGAGADIIDRAGGLARGGADRLTLLRIERRRRRFLDHLLVPPLQGAFALEQRQQIAVAVADHLHLDVARILDVFLDQHAIVAERRLGLALGADDRRRKLGCRTHDTHAAAAATGRRLDQHRKADLVGGLGQRRVVLSLAVIARHHRHAGLFHQRLGAGFRAHRDHHLGGRTDEHQPRIGAGPGKIGILRQEAVAGMHGFGAAPARGVDHALDIEIAVARPRRPEQHRLIGFGDMHRAAIGLGIDRDACAGPSPARCGSRGRRSRRDWRSAGCEIAGTVWSDPSSHPEQAEFRVGSIGALAAAERPRPSTSLVSAGSITPSSQSRAVA